MQAAVRALEKDAPMHLGCLLISQDLSILASGSGVACDAGPMRGIAANNLHDFCSDSRLVSAVGAVLAGGEHGFGQCDLGGKDGHHRVAFEVRRLEGSGGPLALVTFSQAETRRSFSKDALTGLPQRDAIGELVADWRESKASAAFTVLFVDLDDFKQLNDAHGHAAGDEVLRCLADRWRRALRECDLVVRYGGDEFVVLLKDVATELEAEPIVERLLAEAEQPVEFGNLVLWTSATIGIAVDGRGDGDVGALIQAADRDMYRRKRCVR
jgi:diguanylate cyclase (GGDEF)-like protein